MLPTGACKLKGMNKETLEQIEVLNRVLVNTARGFDLHILIEEKLTKLINKLK